MVWPITASQRSRTSVSRRTLRPERMRLFADVDWHGASLPSMRPLWNAHAPWLIVAAAPLAPLIQAASHVRFRCPCRQITVSCCRPPLPSTDWSRSTRPRARSTASRLRSNAAPITGLLGGNGAGKTTTIAMILGLVMPTSGSVAVLGAEMPRQRYQVLHRMNFESPYIDMPHRLTVRQNLHGVRHGSTRSRICASASPRSPTSSTWPNFSTGRPASCRPGRRPAWRSPRR